LAILLVVGHHFFVGVSPDGPVVLRAISLFFRRLGWTGVDLFFVLSGFLVGGLLFAELHGGCQLRVGRFLARRGLKIWPGYIALLAWMTLTVFVGGVLPGVDPGLPNGSMAMSSWSRTVALMGPNWLHLQNYWSTIRIHTWSLAVEEHFYLALPYVIAVLARTGRIASSRTLIVLGGAASAALLARFGTWVAAPRDAEVLWTLAYPTHLRVDSLLCGVMLAWVSRFRPLAWQALQRRRAWCLAAGCVLVLSVGVGGVAAAWVNVIGLTILYLGYGLILIAAVSFPLDGSGVLTRALAATGVYSYSIYLWHLDFAALPTKAWSQRLGGSPVLAWWLPLLALHFALAIGVGVVLAKAVEFPCLRLRERLVPS
jgi:peptidoglycan/LPS O-acetylase OafA/YrhL